MPRGPRVDVFDGPYHLTARRVERRPIFRTDRDRQGFLRRMATVVEEEDLRLFAFVLMGNHFHLVVRREGASIGHCMKRVLTGYGVGFNLRHQRAGSGSRWMCCAVALATRAPARHDESWYDARC
jgi:REP element-mobilizing transposase RayT